MLKQQMAEYLRSLQCSLQDVKYPSLTPLVEGDGPVGVEGGVGGRLSLVLKAERAQL